MDAASPTSLTIQSVWTDSSVIPVYCAALSAIHLSVSAIWRRVLYKPVDETNSQDQSDSPQVPYWRRRIHSIGNVTISYLRLLQFLAVFALFLLSLAELFDHEYLGRRQHARDPLLVIDIAHCVIYGYVTLLSTCALMGSARLNRVAFVHASLILAATWGFYMYRDVWPLATLDRSPADAAEGPILWAKLSLLSLGGVVIPLFSPRKYTPVDPQAPLPVSSEQTASIFSLLLYTYLELFIWRARRLSHITYDMLPPLPDYDHLKNLVGRSFPMLDPMQTKSQRHLGLLFIRVFWFELCNLAAMAITAVVGAFAAPVSINQLLQYLESGRTDAPIKPWFWIALFGFGRLFKDVSDEWFMYYTTRLSVRTQAIITELVFEHALRIRVKADTPESSDIAESNSTTAVVTPDNASQLCTEGTRDGSSIDGENESGEASHSVTVSSSTAVPPASNAWKGKATSTPTDKSTAGTDAQGLAASDTAKSGIDHKKDPGKHLVGRINNLVSSDLSNLENVGMWAIFLSIESPFQITLCIIFLYQILGWSALVGLATMLITLPLPGWITQQIQGAHREKMRRTDSRVQTVTETMNVIRMIKLFGWEPRIAAQLDKKREEELISVRQSKLLTLFINSCKYPSNILPILIMLSTFFTYTVIMKEELTASRVFSSMAVFEMLRLDLHSTFSVIPQLIQGKSSRVVSLQPLPVVNRALQPKYPWNAYLTFCGTPN
ncbi:hypothetical protein NUW54_g1089 [Trametes sanguinea]|uniref:Uncharacterized protein n=1 Tax=Trametes sanguinea TaxID=158606 RepID=A0ACC1QB47_9APHY|nr:hypothetical protein NUW54_g1089 [Trametes sanguinea]